MGMGWGDKGCLPRLEKQEGRVRWAQDTKGCWRMPGRCGDTKMMRLVRLQPHPEDAPKGKFPVLNGCSHLESKAIPAWGLGALQAQEEPTEHLQLCYLCVHSWPAVVTPVQQLGSLKVGAQC